MKKSRLLCAVYALAFTVFSNAVIAASFTALGDFAGGSMFSEATGVSADGSVVVGDSSTASGAEAFRWTSGGGKISLGGLPGASDNPVSAANGVSADGLVVVGKGNRSVGVGVGVEAFRWTSGGGMVGLGDLGDDLFSFANGVSADGSVVVGQSHPFYGAHEAFRWTSGGGMVGLGDLPGGGINSYARGVSSDGLVIVGSGSSSDLVQEPFRWTSDGGMVSLGIPGGASGVSSDGSVIVGSGTFTIGLEAFRWTSSSGMVGLGDLAGGVFNSVATGVSADGSVVVGRGISDVGSEAIRWTDSGGMETVASLLTAAGIDLTGWTLSIANAVSADGAVIVGGGWNPSGYYEGWVANLGSKPVADAGDNMALAERGPVVLDGTNSFDVDGDSISFFWALSTPAGSSAMLDDPTSDMPSFIADQYGDYVATLVVTDIVGRVSDPDSVTVGFSNVEPVADAGLNQAVVVGDAVVLDGSGSTDVNMDMLTYLWRFDSIPLGSGAALVNPTTDSPRFVPDEAGDYNIRLVVNDGLLNSAPDTVSITAVNLTDAVTRGALDLIAAINVLVSDDFNNRNMQNALINKVIAVLQMIDRGNYREALDKLTFDVLPKTDGCTISGSPDSNDWITNCAAQTVIYPLVLVEIELLQRLI